MITKDLSRLGRDYIQTGYYTEVYFSRKHVRYIALNDRFDSMRDDNDIAPFKNILNDMSPRICPARSKLQKGNEQKTVTTSVRKNLMVTSQTLITAIN